MSDMPFRPRIFLVHCSLQNLNDLSAPPKAQAEFQQMCLEWMTARQKNSLTYAFSMKVGTLVIGVANGTVVTRAPVAEIQCATRSTDDQVIRLMDTFGKFLCESLPQESVKASFRNNIWRIRPQEMQQIASAWEKPL